MGARMLRQWLNQPLLDLDELKLRQRRRAHDFTSPHCPRTDLRTRLGTVGDIQRMANRAITGTMPARASSFSCGSHLLLFLD